MITSIQFPEAISKDYVVVQTSKNETSSTLDYLSKLNIFIGPNNSGKSRFLRGLFSGDLSFDIDNLKVEEVISFIKEAIFRFQSELNKINYEFTDADNVISSLNGIINEGDNFINTIDKAREILKNVLNQTEIVPIANRDNVPRIPILIQSYDVKRATTSFKQLANALLAEINNKYPENIQVEFSRIYLPILRGLRPIHIVSSAGDTFSNTSDNYKQRTIYDYFKGGINDELVNGIYSGLDLYNDLKKRLLNRREERKKIRSFEEFLSGTFFSGQRVSLIPDHNHDVVNIGIGDEERPIYDKGDGIQALITILYPLYLNRDKNLLVFIEEPELSLHPGMQRILIEALLSDDLKNCQYFITTHSNHFLDITLDLKNISVYTFHKRESAKKSVFEIENTTNDNLRILDLIGARNSSVFLSNCTIWVEGITDRLYLRRYLFMYQQSLIESGQIVQPFKEDIHFSFIEYGGGNIVHYSFSESDEWGRIKSSRIGNRILLVADTDSTLTDPKSAKALRLRGLKKSLGKNFVQIEGREIENTLSEKVLIKTLVICSKKGDFITDKQREISLLDYKFEPIGKYIKKTFTNLKTNYAEKSGTIKNKVKFCQTATEEIKSVEDLSPAGLKLAKVIFEFIKRNNSN